MTTRLPISGVGDGDVRGDRDVPADPHARPDRRVPGPIKTAAADLGARSDDREGLDGHVRLELAPSGWTCAAGETPLRP